MVDLQHVRENAPDGNEMLDRFRNDGPEELNEALDEMGLDIKEDVHRVYIGGTVRGDDNAPLFSYTDRLTGKISRRTSTAK